MCTPPTPLLSRAQIDVIRLEVMARPPDTGIWITSAPRDSVVRPAERAATRKTNCPNCGAPHGGEPVCSYCTTVF